MEAMGRFAGGIAHDFSNVLTAIGGFAQLLRDDVPVAGPGLEYLEEIVKGVRRAGELTRQLLAFSRKQTLQPRVVDMNKLVRGMEGILRRIIGENVELSTVLATGLGRVRADPSQIEQAIMNLVVNARDAMPDGGSIVLETSEIRRADSRPGSHGVLPPGRYVALRVSDTGTGMTPEVLSHIYEPFYTTKEQGKGTGLGLSTVYGIVKQSSGSIDVETTASVGTSFRILLPVVDGEITETGQNGKESGRRQGTETILVVEDDAGVLELAARALADQGYNVLQATRAGDALRIWRESGTPIHLVVTDIVMPGGMSGRDLAHELSSLSPGNAGALHVGIRPGCHGRSGMAGNADQPAGEAVCAGVAHPASAGDAGRSGGRGRYRVGNAGR